MSISVTLPLALLQSDDYMALNDDQRRNFLARLRYCREIAEKAATLSRAQNPNFLSVVDDIELDVLSIMSGFGDVDSTVSLYKVHSSWTFECDRRSMAALVPIDVADFLRQPPIGLTTSMSEAIVWLDRWRRLLDTSLDFLTNAPTFTAAVTHLIIIDAVVSSYLVFAACIRLSVGALDQV